MVVRNAGLLALLALVGCLAAAPTAAQTVTTQEDYYAADMAEMKALAQEAKGDVYSLPHDKKMRVAAISLKLYIKDNFIDPESVRAVITNDPHHVDLKVWQGLLGGGHQMYSGMAICARINGKNRLGGYTGDKEYLVIVLSNGAGYQAFWSPYYNEYTQTDETNATVTGNC